MRLWNGSRRNGSRLYVYDGNWSTSGTSGWIWIPKAWEASPMWRLWDKEGDGQTTLPMRGMLVSWRAPFSKGVRVGRITDIWEYDSLIVVMAVGAKETLTLSREMKPRFLALGPIPDDPEPTLSYRRQRLFRTLSHIVRTDRRWEVREAASLLTTYLTYGDKERPEDTWFWNTVALSRENPKKVSYAPTIEGVDDDKQRRFSSLAKFLSRQNEKYKRALLPPEFIEPLSTALGEHLPKSWAWEFVEATGAAAVRAYRESPDSFGSCMSQKSSVALYAESPETVAVLKIMQGGEYVGRALLWTTNEGVRVLDRIYPSDNGPHKAAVHAYCDEQGWDYKLLSNNEPCGLKSGREDYTVTLQTPGCGEVWQPNMGFPYMDTFYVCRTAPGNHSQMVLRLKGRGVLLRHTDGRWSGHPVRIDENGPEMRECRNCGAIEREGTPMRHGVGPHEDHVFCPPCWHRTWVELDYVRPDGVRVQGTVRIAETYYCEVAGCGRRQLHAHMMRRQTRHGRRLILCTEHAAGNFPTCYRCESGHREVDHEVWHGGQTRPQLHRVCEECYYRYYRCCDTCGFSRPMRGGRISGWRWECRGCQAEALRRQRVAQAVERERVAAWQSLVAERARSEVAVTAVAVDAEVWDNPFEDR